MAYGSKYRMQVPGFLGVWYEVRLKKLSYSSGYTILDAGSLHPIEIEELGEGDPFNPVRGKLCRVSFSIDTAGLLNEVFTDDPKGWMMEVYEYRSSAYNLLFQGYCLKDEHDEPYISAPYTIVITASGAISMIMRTLSVSVSNSLVRSSTNPSRFKLISSRSLIDFLSSNRIVSKLFDKSPISS